MNTKQTPEKDDNKDSFKETMMNEIASLLTAALPALKESLGEKKFVKRIRKAAKLLSEGIKPVTLKKEAAPKTAPPPKTISKKTTVASPAKKAKKSLTKK